MIKGEELSGYERFGETVVFLSEFLHETDRAAVVLGGAKLDLLLHRILQKHFLSPIKSDTDPLLDQSLPLGSFGPKIDIAYRVGLIDSEFAKVLHLFRKIRNDFAHEVVNCDLNNQANQSRMKELVAPFVDSDWYKHLKEDTTKNTTLTGVSLDFRVILGMTVVQLNALYGLCPKVSSDKAMPILLPPRN